MQNKVVCCFGHRNVYRNISDALTSVVEDLITNENAKTFMTGGMGEFDGQFAATVRGLQRKYPDIELLLVKPYFSNELNTNKEYYKIMYDDVVIPDAVAGVHPKSAIKKRNRWMVENSDYIIGFVYRDFGGAYDAIKYAHKLGKQVFNLAENEK